MGPQWLLSNISLLVFWVVSKIAKINIFVIISCSFLAVLALSCCSGFSLVAVCGLLTAVTSSVATPGLESTDSIAVAQRVSCSVACGIFPYQGSNPCLLYWQVDSLPPSHERSPPCAFLSYWSIVNLQCCVNFCCYSRLIQLYTYVCVCILFHYGLSQDIEYSSLH